MPNPVLVDTSTSAPVLIGQNTQCGPAHGAGGALYLLMDTLFSVFKSTDNGNTWSSLTALPANFISACLFFDGTGFWIFSETSSNVGNNGTLTSFDAVTETFGGVFNAPTDVLDAQLCQSGNGTVHLASNAKTDDGRDLVLYSAFNGATFSGPLTLYDISISDPVQASEMTQQVLFTDENDDIHILAQSDTNEDTNSPRVWHWVTSNTGTLISPTQLVIGPVSTLLNSVALGKGCDADGTLYVLYGDNTGFIKALVGSGPLTGPSWIEQVIDSTPVVDSNFLGKGITAGGKSFLIYGVNHLLRTIEIVGGVLGSPQTLYDSDLVPPPPPLVSGYIIDPTSAYIPALGTIGIGFNEFSSSDSGQHGFFLPFAISPPPAPAVIPPNPNGGGASPFGPSVSPFAPAAEYNKSNVFNHCLCQKYVDWGCIDWEATACCVPPDYVTLGFGEDPDDEMFDSVAPYQYGAQIGGVRFYKSNTILCPAAIDGDVPILNFQVPVGYDAVLSGLVVSYLGSGFIEGSGDLIFRIKLNRYFAKDFGNIKTSLGTARTPYPTQVLAGSLSTIQFLVNAPNTSGGLQPGVIKILAQAYGWWWPQDETARFQRIRSKAA